MGEGFRPEEIKAIKALTLEELEKRRSKARVAEERARHERQLCEWEYGRRVFNKTLTCVR